MATKRKVSPATRAELRACKNLGGERLAGPGQPDCGLPDGRIAEVKRLGHRFAVSDYRRAMAAPVYRWRKPDVLCVTGPHGFSREARDAASQEGVVMSKCSGRVRRARSGVDSDRAMAVAAGLGLAWLVARALQPTYRLGAQP